MKMVLLFCFLGVASAIPQQGYRQGLSFELTEKRVEGEHVDSRFNELLTSTQGSLLAHPLLTLLATVLLVLGIYLLFIRFCQVFENPSDMRVILQPKGAQRQPKAAQVRRYTAYKELL
jgi:hypothetical protein